MATVNIHALNKRYPNGNHALRDINLSINAGELIVIVGPSGCGKSTLLRTVAGLESISDGELYIDEQRVNDKEPAARDIAMVFQNYALYPHMSVFDNMAYALKNRGVDKAKRTQRVTDTARLLGLESLLERRPRQLSGGQRQRVAMGRAIVRDPKIFLFDEPLSNLDAALRVQMRLEIRRLLRQLNTTAIYVTHDQVEAMTLADRLVVMRDGRIEQVGTPLELYQRPATPFVAQFMGSPAMNVVALPDTLAEHWRELLAPHASAVTQLGIRPEHLTECSANDALLSLKVSMVESLGAETLVYGDSEHFDQPWVVRLGAHRPISEGELLHVNTTAQQLHLFDASGARIARSGQ
ncbi:ABC transporter ATP-binding protein [Carnimonas bestiolae]|uniref:ABC transporter ATP-binding protein n=1 Tax=Carnimonas bestiolae TaxID=3402172 RepID=UPI003EDC0C88